MTSLKLRSPYYLQSPQPRALRLAVAAIIAAGLLMASPEASAALKTNGSVIHDPACAVQDAGLPGGLSLPSGFCASVFADRLGHVSHLVVAASGVVYVNTPHGVMALEETSGSGRAAIVSRFGDKPGGPGVGGTALAIYKGALYADESDRIVRYDLPADSVAPLGPPETVVSGLPATGNHPFAIDGEGGLFVALGSDAGSNGGLWRYDANQTGQAFSPAARFAGGIRDVDAIAIEHGIATNAIGLGIYLTEHRTLPGPMSPFPAARLLKANRGDKQASLALFPGQMVPSDLVLYDRRQFPARYNSGAFIAFRASRPNGAPFPEGSGTVMFQPFANGKPKGELVAFAKSLSGAACHPSGLAAGPDGALYVADDHGGRIWRITYRGPMNTETAAKS